MAIVEPTITITFTPPSTDTDVTGYGRAMTTRRGRTGPFDAFATGVATIILDNRSRLFDPLHAAGTHYGKILPGRKVVIDHDGVTLFTGLIEDWDHAVDVSGDSVVTLMCEDAFGQLARKSINARSNSVESAGDRIATILALAEVDYDGSTSLDSGGWTELQADAIADGENALNYLQRVARTDVGRLYVDRSGVLTFRDRLSTLSDTPEVTFADDGTGVAYHGVTLLTGSELLRNYISITPAGGTVETSTDATSIGDYGVRRHDESGLLLNYQSDAADMADRYRRVYKDPKANIASLTVKASALSDSDRADVTALDIASVVRVKLTPNGVGSAIDQTLVVEGVEHSQTRGGVHLVTLWLAEIDQVSSPFILGTSVLGGSDVLAF